MPVIYAVAAAISAPIPIPAITRPTNNIGNDVANPEISVPTVKKITEIIKAIWRPNLSELKASLNAPMT